MHYYRSLKVQGILQNYIVTFPTPWGREPKPVTVWIMAWRMLRAKPLAAPVLTCEQCELCKATLVKIGICIMIFVAMKALEYAKNRTWLLYPWWRHQIGTFSALLVICAGNPPVSGEFPAQMTRKFDVFLDLRPNKLLSKQSWDWWFETPSRPLWRHRSVGHNVFRSDLASKVAWRQKWHALTSSDMKLLERRVLRHITCQALIKITESGILHEDTGDANDIM